MSKESLKKYIFNVHLKHLFVTTILVFCIIVSFFIIDNSKNKQSLCQQIDIALDHFYFPIARELLMGEVEVANSIVRDLSGQLKNNVANINITLGTHDPNLLSTCSGTVLGVFFHKNIEIGANNVGSINIKLDKYNISSIALMLVSILCFVALIMFINFKLIFKKIDINVIQPISKALRNYEDVPENNIVEIDNINVLIDDLKRKVATEEQIILSKQVAHDIRSPLAALDVVIESLDNIDEELLAIIHSASSRIHDIANDLLAKNRKTISENNEIIAGHIPSLLKSIIAEKRMEYSNRGEIELRFPMSEKYYGKFARVNDVEFKRVISNLINNAVEAFDNSKGIINVTLESVESNLKIGIRDNGHGMSDRFLDAIRSGNFSSEKRDGNGIGLKHTFDTVKSWGGDIEIMSDQGRGTTLTLFLPPVAHPNYFLGSLNLSKIHSIAIIDDDESIHKLWGKRFSASHIRVEHFYNKKGLEQALQPESFGLYLFDYEFANQNESGLEMIEYFHLEQQSVLVTSHFDEKDILEKCIKLGVPLIEKAMAGFIPIHFE